MVKQDLIEKLAEAQYLTTTKSREIVECIGEILKDTINGGEDVFLRGFGTFRTKTYKARKGRNVRANTIIDIPERKKVVFKVSKNF